MNKKKQKGRRKAGVKNDLATYLLGRLFIEGILRYVKLIFD